MKTYVFDASFEQEADGRWSAWIEAFPACAAWGYSKEEALEALREVSQAYIEVLLENGQNISGGKGVSILDAPAVSVTV